MSTTKVATEELRNKAQVMTSTSQTMYDKLGAIKKEVNALEPYMDSEAGRAIRTHMNNMQGKFEEYKSVVDSYADALRKAADEYDGVEVRTTKNADQFA